MRRIPCGMKGERKEEAWRSGCEEVEVEVEVKVEVEVEVEVVGR